MKQRHIPVIADVDQAENAMAEVRKAQRAHAQVIAAHGRAVTALENQIKRIDTKFGKKAKIEREHIHDLITALFAFAQENRGRLAPGKKKMVRLPRGSTMEWHLTPGKAVINDMKAALAFLKKRRKLASLIHIEETLDKKGLRRHIVKKGPIPGVELERREDFRVKPAGITKPIIEQVEDLKRAIT
jgi:phage host-nuclease inhibitor protein Gam